MRYQNRSSASSMIARRVGASLVLLFSIPLIALDSRRVERRVMPDYPELARRMHVSGTVLVQATVAPNGKVLKAVASSGHALLLNAAQSAVMHWRFAPEAAESQVTVEVKFDAEK